MDSLRNTKENLLSGIFEKQKADKFQTKRKMISQDTSESLWMRITKWEHSQGFLCLKMIDVQGEGEATDKGPPSQS